MCHRGSCEIRPHTEGSDWTRCVPRSLAAQTFDKDVAKLSCCAGDPPVGADILPAWGYAQGLAAARGRLRCFLGNLLTDRGVVELRRPHHH